MNGTEMCFKCGEGINLGDGMRHWPSPVTTVHSNYYHVACFDHYLYGIENKMYVNDSCNNHAEQE